MVWSKWFDIRNMFSNMVSKIHMFKNTTKNSLLIALLMFEEILVEKLVSFTG